MLTLTGVINDQWKPTHKTHKLSFRLIEKTCAAFNFIVLVDAVFTSKLSGTSFVVSVISIEVIGGLLPPITSMVISLKL